MRHTTLIVPGLYGSGPGHWQSWLERELPDARRVGRIDWDHPVLAQWAGEIRREIDRATSALWLVAHSFGCLASVVAGADRPDKVAGMVLVAPADPARFTPIGLRDDVADPRAESVAAALPDQCFPFPSVVVASRNDPWVKLMVAGYWAERWGSRLVDIGEAGHLNIDSGHGPWPFVLELVRSLQAAHEDAPLGNLNEPRPSQKGRRSALARVRRQTRASIDPLAG